MRRRPAPLAGASALALILAFPAGAQDVPALPGGATTTTTAAAGAQGNGAPPQAAIPGAMPPALPAMSPGARLAAREARALGMASRWRSRSCGTAMGADGVLEVQHGACEPVLVCSPFRWCVVALEPGEGPTDLPDIGDPRWQYQLRWAVEGMRRVMHVRFRPTDAGLDSNFVLNTNQRSITLRLQSTQRSYMPFLKLGNPNFAARQQWARAAALESVAGVRAGGGAACDGMPTVPPSAYAIDAPRRSRPWAPVQVYGVTTANGARTCIEFPADIGSVDLPTLVVRDAGGVHQLVTSRLIGRRMEVDALVNSMELVTGVGRSQVSVSIARKEYR